MSCWENALFSPHIQVHADMCEMAAEVPVSSPDEADPASHRGHRHGRWRTLEVAARATTPVVETMQKREGKWRLTLWQARGSGGARAHIGHRNVTHNFHTTDSTLARGRRAGFFCKRKRNEGERSTEKAEGEKDNIRSMLEQIVDRQPCVLAVVDGLRHEPSSPTSSVTGAKTTRCLK